MSTGTAASSANPASTAASPKSQSSAETTPWINRKGQGRFARMERVGDGGGLGASRIWVDTLPE